MSRAKHIQHMPHPSLAAADRREKKISLQLCTQHIIISFVKNDERVENYSYVYNTSQLVAVAV